MVSRTMQFKFVIKLTKNREALPVSKKKNAFGLEEKGTAVLY